jgi:hypothetical protein
MEWGGLLTQIPVHQPENRCRVNGVVIFIRGKYVRIEYQRGKPDIIVIRHDAENKEAVIGNLQAILYQRMIFVSQIKRGYDFRNCLSAR